MCITSRITLLAVSLIDTPINGFLSPSAPTLNTLSWSLSAKGRFYILSGGKAGFWLGRTKYEINTHGHIIHRRLMYIRNHHT